MFQTTVLAVSQMPILSVALACIFIMSLSDRGQHNLLMTRHWETFVAFATFCRDYFRFFKNCLVISRFSHIPSELDRIRFQRSDISSVLYVELCPFNLSLNVLVYTLPQKEHNAEPPCYEKNACKTKVITLEVFCKYFF